MTPEERAATVMTFYRALVNRHGDKAAACEAIVEQAFAAAIREAVDAETEACAAIADGYAESADGHIAEFPDDDWARGGRADSEGIAGQIRQRAVSRSAGAPS